MNIQTKTNLLIRTSLVLTLALASWLPTAATAEEEPVKPMKVAGHKMMQDCQRMKEQKEKMMAVMKEQDDGLTREVAMMNSADQDKKTDMMAAIITKMVEQRTSMDAHKAKMQEEMMHHMMRHMEMGNESMAQCPMMKDIKDTGHKSPDVKKEEPAEEK